jgi:hypothetical protein
MKAADNRFIASVLGIVVTNKKTARWRKSPVGSKPGLSDASASIAYGR